MLKPSGALTAQQVVDYHKKQWASSAERYFSEDNTKVGQWYGKLAESFGLRGDVDGKHFERLAYGQHPFTGEQLIKHRKYKSEQAASAEHRAGWDLQFAPPKSVSVTALVAGDDRVREAHSKATKAALDAVQEYVQAWLPKSTVRTTGNMVAALFEHDTSRPVAGKPAPQLHTHVVMMNMTDTGDKIRALETREIFRTQSYATAVYRAELATELQKLGYRIERSEGTSFEIAGYSQEYLEAASPRHEQIQKELDERGLRSAKAGKLVALSTREDKVDMSQAEFLAMVRAQAAEFGDQPDMVRAQAAKHRNLPLSTDARNAAAHDGITHAKNRQCERTAVFDEYEILRDALNFNQSKITLADARKAFGERLSQENPEFKEVTHYRTHAPGHRYTTPEMERMEEGILGRIRDSQESVRPVCTTVSLKDHPDLQDNPIRQKVLERVLTTASQFVAIQGAAGSRKTTSLMVLKPYIENAGYELVAYAPTGGATNELTARGIKADTLQMLLATAEATAHDPPNAKAKYYVVDETSLADTEQIHRFMKLVRPSLDHVLFVGDDSYKRKVGQHKSVGAGRIFHEMQASGMKTAELNKMYRQKTPQMQQIASLLRDGQVGNALTIMDRNGMVHETPDLYDRLKLVALDYASNPHRAFIVNPDNETRKVLNEFAREAMKEAGHIRTKDRYSGTILVPRETRKTDTLRAQGYQEGDVLRYTRKNATVGVKARDYADVIKVDVAAQKVTVRRRTDGQEVTYDPRTGPEGPQVYSKEERRFAIGERIQFTDAIRSKTIANRDTGTIIRLTARGGALVKLDKNGKKTKIDLRQAQCVEYAYAMTSHSLQGKTLSRALFHVDTGDPRNRQLLGQDMLYVVGTRGEYDFRIYSDDKEEMEIALSRECVKPVALSPERIKGYRNDYEMAVAV